MENITIKTRQLSFDDIQKNKEIRYKQILAVLENKQMTAKEIAIRLCEKGLIPTSERNFVAPRLTELVKKGVVRTENKKICQYTGKKVAIYEKVRN